MKEKSSNKDTGAGKGDKPRNCFSRHYYENYDVIKWGNKALRIKKKKYNIDPIINNNDAV